MELVQSGILEISICPKWALVGPIIKLDSGPNGQNHSIYIVGWVGLSSVLVGPFNFDSVLFYSLKFQPLETFFLFQNQNWVKTNQRPKTKKKANQVFRSIEVRQFLTPPVLFTTTNKHSAHTTETMLKVQYTSHC